MSFTIFLLFISLAGALVAHALDYKVVSRELSRLRGREVSFVGETKDSLNRLAAEISALSNRDPGATNAKNRKLIEAGLETKEASGKFYLMRVVCWVVGPVIGLSSYMYWIPYYATIFTLFSSMLGLIIPELWLRSKIHARSEEIQRELPLVLDLTNLGTSAGWDVGSALEKVIDSLYSEFPDHPLIRELKKARWLISSGVTWEEAFKRISDRLGDDTVRRTTLALAQAIKQGGDRSSQLEGIAQDAQRGYYSRLDKRLAALPVKVVVASVLILCAYLVMIMAPAAATVSQIKLPQMAGEE